MAFVHDTFTAPNGTLLRSRAGETGATWIGHDTSLSADATVQSNRVFMSGAGIVLASGVPPGADYSIESEVHFLTSTGNPGIMGRLQSSAVTGYLFRYRTNVDWQLYKAVNNTLTLLDSFPDALTAGQTRRFRLELEGTAQRGYVDDVLVCEAADTEITAAGQVGIRDTAVVTSTTGKHLGYITASALGIARTMHPVLTIGSSHVGPLRFGKD
jgi:hypothetical protein